MDPLIQQRLSILNPEYATLVQSDFADTAAIQFGTPHQFDEAQVGILSNAITLYLLCFLDFSAFAEFIATECDLPLEDATTLAHGIVATLPEGFTTLHDEAIQQLLTAAAATQPQVSVSSPNTSAGIRTMAQDIQQAQPTATEATYTSTQEALLREGAPPTPQPPTQTTPQL